MATAVQPLDPNAPPRPNLTLAQGGQRATGIGGGLASQAPSSLGLPSGMMGIESAPQAPGMAGGTPPQLSLASPSIPAPTVAAPSAPVNRLDLATNAFDTLEKARAPGDRRALENVTSQAAGLGQVGSGQWRTALTNANNERQLQLDTARDTLVNKATEGSIADASTAYQQALSGAQQGLAGELGRGNLDVAREGADTARIGTTGGLDVSRGQLELAKGEATGSVDGQQTLAAKTADLNAALATAGLTGVLNGQETLQAKQAAIQNAIAQGHLTNEQGQLALQQLAESHGNTIATGELELAQTGQATQLAQEQQKIDLAALSQQQSVDLAKAGLDINKMSADTAAKAQKAMEDYQKGELSLSARDAALRELAQAQGNALATGQLDLAKTENTQRNALDVANTTGTYGGPSAGAVAAAQGWQNRVGQNMGAAVTDALAGGIAPQSIIQELRAQGWSQADAQKAVQDHLSSYAAPGQLTLAAQGQQISAQQFAQQLTQQNSQFNASLAQTGAQFNASLAENARQFGLSQTQASALAQLQNATANRSIDVSQAQGRSQVLIQLAQILGGPTGSLNPAALAEIARSFGITIPNPTTDTKTDLPPNPENQDPSQAGRG